jgi:hypothetical protein
MLKNDESKPQVLVPASEQQAGIVSAAALGIAMTTLSQVFVPQVMESGAAPALLPPAETPPLPLLPPAAAGPESDELPHAGMATAATRAPTKITRTARKNIARQSSMRGPGMRVLPAATDAPPGCD